MSPGHPHSLASSLHQAYSRSALLTVLALGLACTPKPDAQPASTEIQVTEPSASAEEPRAAGGGGGGAQQDAVPYGITLDQPLRAGLVSFSGMVRPTKGGLDVRGVTFSLEALNQALAESKQQTRGYNDLLGCRAGVVAELKLGGEAAGPETDHVAVQRRGGVYFVSSRLVSAKIEAEAEQIEGQIGRSKGLFSVSSHLVSRQDLNWAVPGAADPTGKRVRLWGQSRTYVCPPESQCLIGGSLPMFDVGRAEVIK